MTIDDALPTWHWRSAHAARVSALPEHADAAIRAVGAHDLPGTGALMRIRGLGRRVFDDRPLLQSMARIGMVVLVDEPGTEATDDAARRRVGRYWRLVGPFSSITRREMLSAIRRRAEA